MLKPEGSREGREAWAVRWCPAGVGLVNARSMRSVGELVELTGDEELGAAREALLASGRPLREAHAQSLGGLPREAWRGW